MRWDPAGSRTAARTLRGEGGVAPRPTGIDGRDAQAPEACGCPRGHQRTGPNARLKREAQAQAMWHAACRDPRASRHATWRDHDPRSLLRDKPRAAFDTPWYPTGTPPIEYPHIYPGVASPSTYGFGHIDFSRLNTMAGKRTPIREPNMQVRTPRSDEEATLSRSCITCTRYARSVFIWGEACAPIPKEDRT